MSSLDQANQGAELFIKGCGYRIENDRVMISIESIGNNRKEDNTSGTLRIQLCAFPSNANHLDSTVLASTTIGEIKGQHFIPECRYDLVFQSPPAGSWQLTLELSEWNGTHYSICDRAYFEAFYQIVADDSNSNESTKHSSSTEMGPTTSEKPTNNSNALKQKAAPKVAINWTEHCSIINKSKKNKLLNVKGIPKKVLERLILERPFQSEKAIINVKGMGPVMLKKLLEELAD